MSCRRRYERGSNVWLEQKGSGTPLFHIQLLLGCTAINFKRLARYTPAASGVATAPAASAAEILLAALSDRSAPRSAPILVGNCIPVAWTISLCLN